MKNKNEGSEFLCSCGKTFVRQHSFLKHIKINHEDNCETSQQNNTEKTSDLHENLEEKNYEIKKCKFCSSTFDTINEYLAHIKTTHQNTKNYFMCSVCGKQYKTKSELTHHINSKCGTLKQFKCKICSQELMSAGSLYNHMLRHNGQRSFMCRFCAKLFFTAGQLKVHERIHTHDKAYVCEVCNKGFCHRQSLITHSTLHTGIKPYQCENCGNSFSCVGNLIKHRKTHADTCGLIPLTTHRVQHPSTKIKVKINTPANSRLKTREKDMELQKELDTLKTELDKKKTENHENNITLPTKIPENTTKQKGPSNTRSNIDEGVTNIFIKEDPKDAIDDPLIQRKSKKYTCMDVIKEIDESPKISPEMHNDLNNLESKEKNLDDSSDELNYDIKCENSSSSDQYCVTREEKIKNDLGTLTTEDKKKYLRKREKKDPNYEKELREFMERINFEKQGYGDCKYCGKRYTNIRWLYKHIKDHENNIPNGAKNTLDVPLHKCSCCKRSFYTKEENLTHQQTVHADILTCQDCDKIFANRDSLRSHQKVFHKGLSRKTYLYICEKCGKQFKQKSYLKCHEERNCDKGPFFECSICNKQFSSRHTRNNHMRIHDPEKKLLCKFCAKSFHWKGQLKIHERSHTGEKPFACLYCPKAFAYRESLITHSTIHTGIKPHLCEGCGSRFSCIGNLIKHRISHASECGSWTYKSQKTSQHVINS